MKLCYPDGKLLLKKLFMNWDQELWNSLKFSKKTPQTNKKPKNQTSEIRQFWCLQHWHLVFPAPSRTAHLRRRNKIKPAMFSFIIHDFTPGYMYVSTNINCNLVISGLSYWFTTIRKGPSLPVLTSCRCYSGPYDAFHIHLALWCADPTC